MNVAPRLSHARVFPLPVVIIFLLLAAIAVAVPFHQPTVDGPIIPDGDDWDPADLVVDDTHDDKNPTANVKRLWCTWDQTNLFIGVTYQDIGDKEAFRLYLDLDQGMGPEDASILDTYAGLYEMPANHSFDLVMGRTSTDGIDQTSATPPGIRLITDNTGTTLDISGSVSVAQKDTTDIAPSLNKARFPIWAHAEFALPWATIYPGLEGSVPPLAVIKMTAVVTQDSLGTILGNGIDIAPDNDGLDGSLDMVMLSNLHASVIDTDGDGRPDPADATITGTVTLPQDPGNGSVSVMAELINFDGREPGAPLSVVTTADGVRTWTLPRLPAGTYRVTTSAVGYFTDVIEVEVAQSQMVTGQDQVLKETTAIGGTITFDAGGPDMPGTITLKSADGEVLQTQDHDEVGGTYTFFVETGGDFIVEVRAETYMQDETPVTVVTGEDQTGIDFNLIRQTKVSGTVTQEELPPGSPTKPQAGTIYFLGSEGDILDSQGFPYPGGPFEFFTPVGGSFTLSANTRAGDVTPIYVETELDIVVTAFQDTTGIDIFMPLAAYVSGTISFEGPAVEGQSRFIDNVNGVLMAASTFDTEGDTIATYLGPGQYRLELEASGYEPRAILFNTSLEDTSLGVLSLTAVRATHLEIINDDGETKPEELVTIYKPEEGEDFTSGRILLAARNDDGLDDLYDLDGRLQGFRLSALKMDDLSAPTGNPVFYSDTSSTSIDSVTSFANGRTDFYLSNTTVEVLRVYLAQPDKEPIAGRIVVACLDPQPKTVLLWTEDSDTLVANNSDEILIETQLYDSAGKPSLESNLPITFSVVSGSSGKGQFDVPAGTTNADGQASSRITATGAGILNITATVVYQNAVLDVVADSLDSGETVLPLVSVAGPTFGWNLSLPSNLSDLVTPISVSAQTIDKFRNPTADPDQNITFTADPANLGTFNPATAVSDQDGRASSTYTPSGTAGLVSITGTGGDLVGDDTDLRLRDLVVIPDPVWYEEPEGHKTFDKTDLTALVVANTPDELLLEIPFQSDWDGLHLHVAFVTNPFDAAGATRDPFEMPVNYGHAFKPDYVLTTKYSANDYGDFRRWNGSGWDFWDPATEQYGSEGSIQSEWVTKEANRVVIRIPKEPFGETLPDSMLLEAYLTQEIDGVKRSAFDSAPQDATLNLTFDYENPEPGDWESTKGPVTLEAWGRTFVTRIVFPTPPLVENSRVTPEEMNAGETLVLEALITPGEDGVGDVVADLSAMGGSTQARMYDDGDSGHGDSEPGDGVYSLLTLVPISNPGGSQDLIVQAFDQDNILANKSTATIDVTPIITPIIVAVDPVGDDHGPNQPDNEKKYYTYPTNIVFVKGAFDLESLWVFETKANVGGELVDMIAFQVSVGDLPDPADPSTANWNPPYAGLNIQKIDILIDSAPGGATATLPSRQAAFQAWDAWEFAILIDGWYKALIPSNGQNTPDSWRDNALRADKDIILISDFDLDVVTALVSKAALGNPTPEDIAKWDIAVCMASHDGDADFGGVRWVNEARSEWQLGGGQNGDRDSNYMDLLLVPGDGHVADENFPQEEILDYESEEALTRLDRGLTPVAIQMSKFQDTGPPVIDTGGKGSVVTNVAPILHTPLAMAVNITDDNRVDTAVFRYRSTGFSGEGWDREVPMGFLGKDNWIVDILPSWLDSNLVYSPIDSTRYLEFEVEATDPPSEGHPEGKTSISPVTTLQIEKNAFCRPQDGTLDTEGLLLLQVDGSVLNVPDKLRNDLVRNHIDQAWTGGEVDPDTMGSAVELLWDVCNIDAAVQKAPVVPEGVPINVFRQVFLATSDSLGGYLDYEEKIPGNAQLSLHYPQEWVPAGLDENLIALYHYNPEADRWLLVGGNVTPTGNNVTATVNQVGTYGLFITEANVYDSGEVISGITLSPNPFSPNGDGLYDDVSISFFLTQEATITVEVYNIYGDRKNVLAQTFPFSGSDITDPVPRRVPGLIWDGADFTGETVPYGIYILRILATYNTNGGGVRTVRGNHPVAVIR